MKDRHDEASNKENLTNSDAAVSYRRPAKVGMKSEYNRADPDLSRGPSDDVRATRYDTKDLQQLQRVLH